MNSLDFQLIIFLLIISYISCENFFKENITSNESLSMNKKLILRYNQASERLSSKSPYNKEISEAFCSNLFLNFSDVQCGDCENNERFNYTNSIKECTNDECGKDQYELAIGGKYACITNPDFNYNLTGYVIQEKSIVTNCGEGFGLNNIYNKNECVNCTGIIINNICDNSTNECKDYKLKSITNGSKICGLETTCEELECGENSYYCSLYNEEAFCVCDDSYSGYKCSINTDSCNYTFNILINEIMELNNTELSYGIINELFLLLNNENHFNIIYNNSNTTEIVEIFYGTSFDLISSLKNKNFKNGDHTLKALMKSLEIFFKFYIKANLKTYNISNLLSELYTNLNSLMLNPNEFSKGFEKIYTNSYLAISIWSSEDYYYSNKRFYKKYNLSFIDFDPVFKARSKCKDNNFTIFTSIETYQKLADFLYEINLSNSDSGTHNNMVSPLIYTHIYQYYGFGISTTKLIKEIEVRKAYTAYTDIGINIVFNIQFANFNYISYKKFLSMGINILKIKDNPFFSDLCYYNKEGDIDYPVDTRSDLFNEETITYGEFKNYGSESNFNCTFIGIDNIYGGIKMKCYANVDNIGFQIHFNEGEEEEIDIEYSTFSSIPLHCLKKMNYIIENIAFWLFLGLFIFFVIILVAYLIPKESNVSLLPKMVVRMTDAENNEKMKSNEKLESNKRNENQEEEMEEKDNSNEKIKTEDIISTHLNLDKKKEENDDDDEDDEGEEDDEDEEDEEDEDSENKENNEIRYSINKKKLNKNIKKQNDLRNSQNSQIAKSNKTSTYIQDKENRISNSENKGIRKNNKDEKKSFLKSNIEVKVKEKSKTFINIFLDNLLELHPLLSLFHQGIFNPILLNIWIFIFNIMNLFSFNAIYFTRNQFKEHNDSEKRDYFTYPMAHHFGRIMLSIATQIGMCLIIKIFNLTGYKKAKKIYRQIKNIHDENERNNLVYNALYSNNKCFRIIFLIILTLGIEIFMAIYSIGFCGIYVHTQYEWVYSGIWAVIWVWGVYSIIYILIISWMETGNDNRSEVYYLKRTFVF